MKIFEKTSQSFVSILFSSIDSFPTVCWLCSFLSNSCLLCDVEYHRREKEDALKAKKQASRKGAGATGTPTRTQKIKFIPSIVLLEAAARNDLEEGEWV